MSTRLNCDPIMPRVLHSCDERLGFWENHGLAFVRAGKFSHRIHGIEPQQRDEFDFIAIFADEQFGAMIPLDVSRRDARKNFVVQHFFICLRVRAFRPSMPDASDHMSSQW
jgi:hypothetical protein